MTTQPHEVTQAYYQNVLDAATRSVADYIDRTLAEGPACSHVDSISFFYKDDDGDATELDFTSYELPDDQTFDRVSACDQMREAGKLASEHRVVCVMLTTVMRDAWGARLARIYAASLFEQRLHVLDGAAIEDGAGLISGVAWRWGDYTRKTWGKGQPFIAEFWAGWEAGVAGRN